MRARDLLRQVMDTYGYFLPEDDPLMSLLRRHVWVRYGDNAAAVREGADAAALQRTLQSIRQQLRGISYH